MKFKLQMLATLIAVAFPVMVSAQEEGKDRAALRKAMMQRAGSGPQAGGFPGGPTGMLIKVLDTDHDGTLSASEIANASKALIQLDKNGDGILSIEEMKPDPNMQDEFAGAELGSNGPPNGKMMGKLFESRDKNGDGKLTGDEIPDRIRDKMKMVDKDGDGSITKAEFAAVTAKMEEGAGKRPGKNNKDGDSGGGVKPKRPSE